MSGEYCIAVKKLYSWMPIYTAYWFITLIHYLNCQKTITFNACKGVTATCSWYLWCHEPLWTAC